MDMITIDSSGVLVCVVLRWGPFHGKDSDHGD